MAPHEVQAQAPEPSPVAPAARSVRRATARRASARRASARSLQSDDEANIMAFLANHPKSTVGVLARSLNLDPEYVAVCVMQLARAGEIDKSADGYSSANGAG